MRILVLLAIALGLGNSRAYPTQRSLQDELNPYPTKPKLTFRADGTFKVTVFSDLHFGENPWDTWGPEHDANSVQLMKSVLQDEKPDYAVLNGDLITGENTFRENSTTLIDEIVGPLNDAKVPFSSTHGNHDNSHNITHMEEIEREQKVAPLSYTRAAPEGVGGTGGPGNYWVPVYATSEGLAAYCHVLIVSLLTAPVDLEPVLILWFFDSRGGFEPGPDSSGVPDWVDESVAEWISTETAAMNAAWGPAENRGALAFVHIPPHLIIDVQNKLDPAKNPGLNADELGRGSVQATSEGDSGKDDAFWKALNENVKNLHAVFSGHDHGDEWCAREPVRDVIFCFGKHSGYGGYTQPDWEYGVRNVLFSSPDPRKGVETWIRLEQGETRARIILDSNYS
ncbi:calcineurin-like phosphoesterase [Moniliophthora roreri MCA 2997]|uniref:Calcineurin-like phosphoesterase n=1 Tax=Moniliophthora roreri (strain MCA 2997) TaxID=1381753 RepID=V2Y4X9_MONRO|nr:calcineurin-like phosphoesterase [Moniliophthora roreri MCA 2997]